MLRFLRNSDIKDSAARHRDMLGWGGLAVVGRALLVLAGPFFLGRAVDLIEHRAPENELWLTVAVMLAFAASTAFCQFWMRWLWIRWSRETELTIRDRLFGHVIRLSPPFFDRNRTGDLISRFTSDMEAVRMGYGPGLMHSLPTFLTTVGAVVLMLSASPLLTVVAAAPLIVLFFFMRRLLPRIHERSLAVQEEQGKVSTRAQESFSGARVVKAFAREEHEAGMMGELSGSLLDQSLDLARTRAMFNSAIELAAGLVTVMVLLFGGLQVIDGAITIGTFMAFNGYLQLLIWPMIALGWTMSLFPRAAAAERRIAAVREVEPEIVDGPGPDLPPGSPGEIEIRGLTYVHPGSESPTLHDIDVRIPGGSTLGIVGATGAGKSTLVGCITRLEDPPPGTVFVDGRDVRELGLDALRSRIAMVPQETFLFSDTIRANVVFGVDDPDDDAIAEAVRQACLDDAIATFPEGLDTLVGERGISLSGGQRQRTAIARALLRETPILILDDALSAVDTETEQRILSGLTEVFAERTTIIISHRVSTVMRADRIVVLEEGRIVESGTHEELLLADGLYADLDRMQQQAEELERF